MGVLRIMCAKSVHWLYGFRPAASAWEKMYSGLFEDVGLKREEEVVLKRGSSTFCSV